MLQDVKVVTSPVLLHTWIGDVKRILFDLYNSQIVGRLQSHTDRPRSQWTWHDKS